MLGIIFLLVPSQVYLGRTLSFLIIYIALFQVPTTTKDEGVLSFLFFAILSLYLFHRSTRSIAFSGDIIWGLPFAGLSLFFSSSHPFPCNILRSPES